MSPLAYYRRKYRLHKAYSRNPRRAMASDILKSFSGIGLVVAISLTGYLLITRQNHQLDQNETRVVKQRAPITVANTTPVIANALVPVLAAETPETGTTVANLTAANVTANSTAANSTAADSTAANSTTGEVLPVPKSAYKDPNSFNSTNPIHGSEWVFQLPDDKFVIQFGTSPDRQLLLEEARAFPTGPIAIYPFKKTPSSQPVYGYSSGIYNSLDEALLALETMPKALVAYGPWIRPIDELKQQIKKTSN